MAEPNWNELRDAYGSAADLPDLLAELEPDPKSPVWGELWGRVCHQGSTFSASPHVLPFLLAAAADWGPSGRVVPLVLAASIVAASETDLDGYTSCVAQLRQLALETLACNELSRTDRIHVIQSVVAFEADRLWGKAFEGLNDGEFVGTCPTCETDLYFVIGQYGFFCSAGDWARDRAVTRTEIHARKPGELAEPGRRLFALTSHSGDAELGDWICHLFGTSTCPKCCQTVDVPMAVAAFETPGDTAQ